MIYIYALVDPRDNVIKYIGKCEIDRLYYRYREHIKRRRNENPRKEKWVDELLCLGLSPLITILEVCNEKNWQEKEIFWIDKYYKTLTNMSWGGKAPIKKFGESGTAAKLKEKQVIEIIDLYKTTNLSTSDLAKFYNISQGSIADIITGKTWKHLTGGIKTTSKINKYKHAKGDKHPSTKLKQCSVPEIRKLRKQGYKLKTLSNMFGVSESVISNVVLGRKRFNY